MKAFARKQHVLERIGSGRSHQHIPTGFINNCVARIVRIESISPVPPKLYDLIDGADRNLGEAEKNKRFSEALEKLCDKLSIPKSVRDFGASPKDLGFLVEESFWLKAAIEQNPVTFAEREVKTVWESLL